jgi:hypothetical protein
MKFTASLAAAASLCVALASCSGPGSNGAGSNPAAGTPRSVSNFPIPARISPAIPPPPPSMKHPASPPAGGRRIMEDTPHPAFFSGETAAGGGVYYLAFSNGNPFGYYSYDSGGNYIYHSDAGWEYYVDASDANNGIYLYDFASGHWWYTSPTFPFPYLYDFTLGAVLYYYPDTTRTGHYTTSPRYFYDFGTDEIITLPSPPSGRGTPPPCTSNCISQPVF